MCFTYFSVHPVQVNVSVKIKVLEDIDEVKMSFSSKFTLVFEWFDKRLTWRDLQDDLFLNVLKDDVLENIWVPTIIFELFCVVVCVIGWYNDRSCNI